MINYKIARRYAKGLFDFSVQSNVTKVLYDEMKSFVILLSESKDLKKFLNSPVIDFKKKQSISKNLFKTYSIGFQHFVSLVIKHKRESGLNAIALEFIHLVDNKNEVQKVSIISAIKLDKKTIDYILTESKFINNNKPIQIIEIIDESLIGGFILRIRDKQIDASIKTKLNKIRNDFDKNEYISKL